MGGRHNRWWRRWIIASLIWAVPVALVALKEIHDELVYNEADLQKSLDSWTFTPAQRASNASAHCHGSLREARASGCPADVVALNAGSINAAGQEFSSRRNTLFSYIGQAIVGYWVVPCLFVLAVGLLAAGVRRSLRRPPRKTARERPSP
jgi:hypothetical protein